MSAPGAPGAGDAGARVSLRIGVWCAVSTKAQAAEDKVSLEEQERAGREFAAAVGGQVVAVYRVPGHTRDLIFWADAERAMPAYRQLREDVQAGRIDVLWNADLDRLGRDPALINQVISLVEKEGGEVYTASTPHVIGKKGAGFRYISAIQAVRAGEDVALRAARHRMGMKGRIAKRGMMASNPPMGYQVVRDPVTGTATGYEFDEDIGAIEEITRLFLAGANYQDIARRMDAGPWQPPGRGMRWWPRTIARTMSNDAYAGLPAWSSFAAAAPSTAYPALWDDATYEQILAERRRRTNKPYVRKGAGPYSGVAYCKRCGGPMYHHRTRYQTAAGDERVYDYLICGTVRRTHGEVRCHNNSLPESRITAEIARFLNWLSTPENLQEALAVWDAGPAEGGLRAELAQNQAQEADLARQRERLGLAMAAGKMDVDLYHKLDGDLRARYEAAGGRVRALRAEIERLPDVDARRLLLERVAEEFPRLIVADEPAALSALLQHAGLTVWCEASEVVEIALD